jgi:hypothetical protein
MAAEVDGLHVVLLRVDQILLPRLGGGGPSYGPEGVPIHFDD